MSPTVEEEAAPGGGGLGELQATAEQIPSVLEALIASHSNVLQISTYCKKAFEAEPDKVYGETKQYTHHALLNAAYHVNQVAFHITSFLQQQTNELEKIDLQIQSMSTRLKVARTIAKSTGYIEDNSLKVYEKQEKAVKLEGSSAPQPLSKWNRQPLGSLDALIAGK